MAEHGAHMPQVDEQEYGSQVQGEQDADAIAGASAIAAKADSEAAQATQQPGQQAETPPATAPSTPLAEPTNLMQRIPHKYELTTRKATADRVADTGLLWQAMEIDPNVHPVIRAFARRMTRGA